MQDLLGNFAIGLETALLPTNLLYCFIGVTLGTFVGVLPGIGALAAISMLFPITYYLEPVTAMVMLGGIYYGTAYGGSIASILLNMPGGPSNAVTCLDGYPLAQQGRAGAALFLTTASSFIGGSIGIIIMMLFSPVLVSVAMEFGSAEYFSLMLAGLIAASVVSTGSAVKSMAMVIVGILLGLVGMDVYTGAPRFTFGQLDLLEGISIVAVAMGMFGVAEVIHSIRSQDENVSYHNVTLRSLIPTRDDMSRFWAPTLRGTGVGSFFGILPGTGAAVASFVSYAVEFRSARDPSRFGKGAVEGIIGPEAANNAADQTSFIPTLVLGIPGSATMALMMGVLMIHGIVPGPRMVESQPQLFWGLVMSFWIGNILLIILNLPLIGIWVRLLTIPYHLLYPAMLMFICIGVYAINNNPFDIGLVIVFGAMGYTMRLLDFPQAPLLLGFVLGPMVEDHFRRAMIVSRGSLGIFVTSPISLSFLLISAALLLWPLYGMIRQRSRKGHGADALDLDAQ